MENRNQCRNESLNCFIRSFTSIGSSMSSNGMPLSKIDGRVGATIVELLAAPCSTGSCCCDFGLPVTWLLHKQTCKQQRTRVKCRSTQPTYGIFLRLHYVRQLWFSDWYLPLTGAFSFCGRGGLGIHSTPKLLQAQSRGRPA
jgi:hypothetical protein